MKKVINKTPDMVLCAGCGEPIHIDDLGGVSSLDGEQAWFHNNVVCISYLNEFKKSLNEPEVLSIEISALQTSK